MHYARTGLLVSRVGQHLMQQRVRVTPARQGGAALREAHELVKRMDVGQRIVQTVTMTV